MKMLLDHVRWYGVVGSCRKINHDENERFSCGFRCEGAKVEGGRSYEEWWMRGAVVSRVCSQWSEGVFLEKKNECGLWFVRKDLIANRWLTCWLGCVSL